MIKNKPTIGNSEKRNENILRNENRKSVAIRRMPVIAITNCDRHAQRSIMRAQDQDAGRCFSNYHTSKKKNKK